MAEFDDTASSSLNEESAVPRACSDTASSPSSLPAPEQESSSVSGMISYSGPLPPPGMLAGYDDICPGAADRIIGMAEKEQLHRHDMDRRIVRGAERHSLYGLVAGTFIASLGFICATVLGCYGQYGLAAAWFAGTVGPVIGIAVYGIYQRRKQDEAASPAPVELPPPTVEANEEHEA